LTSCGDDYAPVGAAGWPGIFGAKPIGRLSNGSNFAKTATSGSTFH